MNFREQAGQHEHAEQLLLLLVLVLLWEVDLRQVIFDHVREALAAVSAEPLTYQLVSSEAVFDSNCYFFIELFVIL